MKNTSMLKIGIFLASFTMCSLMFFVWAYQLKLPFADHWAIFIKAPEFFASGWGLKDLWAQHNEHRTFIPNIFHMINLLFFAGGNGFLLWVMMLSQFVILSGILYFIFQQTVLSKMAKAWLTIIVVILLFVGTQLENFTWPFQIQFLLCNLFVVFALIFYTKSVVLNLKGIRYYLAACVMGVLAVLTSSQGLVALCAIALLSLLVKDTKFRILGILLLTGLMTFIYLLNYVKPASHPSLLTMFESPLSLFAYASIYIGNGFSRMLYPAGVMGVLGMILSLYAFVLAWRKGWMREPLFILGTGLQLYAVGVMLITAMGRLGIGVWQAISGRYTTISLLFWLGLALVLFLQYARTPMNHLLEQNRYRYSLFAGFLCMMFILIFSARGEMRIYARKISNENQVVVAFEMGVYDEERLKDISPNPQEIWNLREFMRSHQLSIFRQEKIILGKNLTEFYQTSTTGCVPKDLNARSLMPETTTKERVLKINFSEKLRIFPWQSYQVFFTNKQQIIQGYALPKTAAFFNKDPTAKWTGYIKMPLNQQQFEIYRVNLNEKSACHVATYSLE
jgi:hypothetical protein